MNVKKSISMRIDRKVMTEIDKAATCVGIPNRSLIIEGILANAVFERKGSELYQYALQGLKKIEQL